MIAILAKSRHPVQSIALLIAAVIVAWTASVPLAAPADPLSQLLCFTFVLAATIGVYSAGRLLERRAAAALPNGEALAMHPYWQFTLREMLLVVLVVSLTMAQVASSRPFATTPFFNSLKADDPFSPTWTRIGMPHPGGGKGASIGPTRAKLDFDVETDIPAPAQVSQVASDLESELQRMLKDSGCSIHEVGHSGNDFSMSYDSGVTEGDLWVFAVQTSEHRWRFLLLVTESRK